MNFKLALVAAAVVGAASSAQAADLAKKAPAAANYVKVCDAYGAGFFYIPGSDTCLKISGLVRVQLNGYASNKDFGAANSVGWHSSNRTENGITTFSRGEVDIDARTATEFGLLRSYIALQVDYTSGGSTSPTLDKGFIQFGGLTVGRAQSNFDFWTGYTLGSYFEAPHSDASTNLFAYTFSFGNGISATLSIEDPSTGGRRVAVSGATNSTTYGGVRSPDVVGNVHIEQAWGKAQLSGVAHQDYGYNRGDKFGYAFLGGVQVNLPQLGAGDLLALQAAYAKGALGYIFAGTNYTTYDYYDNGTSLKQSSAWSVTGAITHNWTKTIATSFEAGYAKVNVDAAGKVGDYSQLDLQANVAWTPVANFTITPEVEYRKIDVSQAGVKDRDAFVGIVRFQRNF